MSTVALVLLIVALGVVSFGFGYDQGRNAGFRNADKGGGRERQPNDSDEYQGGYQPRKTEHPDREPPGNE